MRRPAGVGKLGPGYGSGSGPQDRQKAHTAAAVSTVDWLSDMTTARVETLPNTTDETAAERALRVLRGANSSEADLINALHTYSQERCVELNSDGATWECPADPADVDVPESAVTAQTDDVLAILDELNVPDCADPS